MVGLDLTYFGFSFFLFHIGLKRYPGTRLARQTRSMSTVIATKSILLTCMLCRPPSQWRKLFRSSWPSQRKCASWCGSWSAARSRTPPELFRPERRGNCSLGACTTSLLPELAWFRNDCGGPPTLEHRRPTILRVLVLPRHASPSVIVPFPLGYRRYIRPSLQRRATF